MTKKFLSLAGFCSALIIPLLFSCQKSTHSDTKNAAELVENAHSWFTQKMAGSGQNSPASPYLTRMQAIEKLLNWEDAKEYANDGVQYVLVPCAYEIKPFRNKSFEAAKMLVFYLDKSGNMKMKISEILSAKGTSLGNNLREIISRSFVNYYTGKNKSTSSINANIIFYNENYIPENSYKIVNGSWLPAKFVLQNKKITHSDQHVSTAGTLSASGYYETWYLVGYFYDLDTGEIISAEIINTWQQCVGICDTWGPVDDFGGTGGGSTNCEDVALQCVNDLSGNAVEASEKVSDNVSNFDNLRKYKNPDWIVLKGPSWAIHSHETGVVKLVNAATNKWQWESLSHVNISFVGTSFGGSIEPVSSTGTPSFVPGTQNVLYAGMSVNYNVKFTPLCNNPLCNMAFPAYTNNYTSNAIFDAKP